MESSILLSPQGEPILDRLRPRVVSHWAVHRCTAPAQVRASLVHGVHRPESHASVTGRGPRSGLAGWPHRAELSAMALEPDFGSLRELIRRRLESGYAIVTGAA